MAKEKLPDPFEEMAKREAELLARLKKSPLVEIVGVVDAMGPGGAQSRGETLWTVLFDLEAWRIAPPAGGASDVRTEPLQLRRQVPETEMRRIQKAIQPYDVIKARARLLEEPTGKSHALIEELLGPASGETALRAIAAELQKPVTRKDNVFGTLTLDRRINTYDGQANWNGKPVKVSLSADENGQFDAALATAHALWRDQADWSRRITDFAFAKLLELKNETWLDEDEKPVTEEDFRRRMKLETISMSEDGSFELWHDDGGLFWGHTIHVSGNLKSGPADAGLAG